jgi:hypothetical protein
MMTIPLPIKRQSETRPGYPLGPERMPGKHVFPRKAPPCALVGQALLPANPCGHASLLQDLSGISQATGGLSFRIRSAGEIGPVFDSVLQDLLHGYLLAFQPPAVEDRAWRRIEVRLGVPASVRARQGYYPE